MEFPYAVATVVQADFMREAGVQMFRLDDVVDELAQIVYFLRTLAPMSFLCQYVGMVLFDESHTTGRRSYNVIV